MSILDKYGIKEVADVTFYELSDAGMPKNPVLYLDTLKVSTIEQTAEETEAKGGKGNPPLIIWDYGKEITVTLEDALFSAKSMAVMFGNGKVKSYDDPYVAATGKGALIMKTEQFFIDENEHSTLKEKFIGPNGVPYDKIKPKYYKENGEKLSEKPTAAGTYFQSFDLAVKGSVIEISANSFPGTYYVTGDTYARSELSGKDEFFQFIIPKAKVQSENTITLEAEGDPSVFNMNLRVLRPADGVMMKLVKYDLVGGGEISEEDAQIFHNHVLDPVTTPSA